MVRLLLRLCEMILVPSCRRLVLLTVGSGTQSRLNDEKSEQMMLLFLGGVQGDGCAGGPLRVAAGAQQTAQCVLVGCL